MPGWSHLVGLAIDGIHAGQVFQVTDHPPVRTSAIG